MTHALEPMLYHQRFRYVCYRRCVYVADYRILQSRTNPCRNGDIIYMGI